MYLLTVQWPWTRGGWFSANELSDDNTINTVCFGESDNECFVFQIQASLVLDKNVFLVLWFSDLSVYNL